MTQTTPTQEGQSPPKDGSSAESMALAFDWQEHRDLLVGCGMTNVQEQEFLEILWSIAVSYVDLTLGLHPAQLVEGKHDVGQVLMALVDEWADAARSHEEAQ